MTMNTSSDQPRVSLCCEPGLYLNRDSICYTDYSLPADEIIFPDIHRANLSISSMSPNEFLPRYRGTHCFVNDLYDLHSDLAGNVFIYLLENGSIYLNEPINGGNSFDIEDYCLASRMTENGTMSVVSVCRQVHHTSDLRNLIINIILSTVSVPFFLAILFIYTVLPEARSLQRHVFRSYIASICISYVVNIEAAIDRFCNYPIMLTLQFSTLATFFWLNVMSFDIWCTFRRLAARQSNTTKKNSKKIIIYNCYAWGIPALMAVIGAVLDFLPVESAGLIRPGLPGNCMFATEAANLVYLTGPVTGALISNVFFFASTMINIVRQKRATAQDLGGKDSKRHSEKSRERFNLYLKLFIVMGISRLASLIAWIFGTLPDVIWYIFAAEGALQGPIIFVLYVWKKNTKKLVLNRLEALNKILTCLNFDNDA